jgi:CheY-like chemotaxis protein
MHDGAQHGARRVLVVDDEPGIGKLVAAALEHESVEVFTAPSAALQRVRAVAFDFVFCDFSMPQMTGIAFYEALVVAQPQLAQRFVLMTGSALDSELGDFLLRSGAKLLTKPFELRMLEPLVEMGCGPRPTHGAKTRAKSGPEPAQTLRETAELDDAPPPTSVDEELGAAAARVADCLHAHAEACSATVRSLRAEADALRMRAEAGRAEAALDPVPSRAAVRMHEAMLANNAALVAETELATKNAELNRVKAQARAAVARSVEHRSRRKKLSWAETPVASRRLALWQRT